MTYVIDHFAIGADSLTQGVADMETRLGVTIPNGSKHDMMSTHNCVMQSGNESFFELIAIDPDAPDPGRVRWFTLDDTETQRRLAERPRALTWVVGCADVQAVVDAAPAELGLGEIVHFTRGDRWWKLTVPKDGSLAMGGLIPGFIQWSPGPHPSTGQQDLGVSLKRVKLTHPDPAALTRTLSELGIEHLADVVEGSAGLAFELDSPNGIVLID